jgi:hypothetical protein
MKVKLTYDFSPRCTTFTEWMYHIRSNYYTQVEGQAK